MEKIKHVAYVIIGLLKTAQRKGLGTLFFSKLDCWAEKRKVRRLVLTVITESQAAVNLYRKLVLK
ncbi:GNAT family N-acetyltransferase [Enterococcus sp. BWB1-3]|uniref:GNAT family N-acetyltransferase n=1 Tax=Enterococcus sp. BWB1-3 TaxID=2787713 RepID=UPI003FA533F1